MYVSGREGRQMRRDLAEGYLKPATEKDPVAEADSGMSQSSVPGRGLGLVAKMRENRAQRQVNRELARQDATAAKQKKGS